jgi:hypothetical protein
LEPISKICELLALVQDQDHHERGRLTVSQPDADSIIADGVEGNELPR